MENGAPVATIKDNDSVVFFNFRPDRAREITRCFCDDDFKGFDRGARIKTTFVCFTDYDPTIPNKFVAFPKVVLILAPLSNPLKSSSTLQTRIW